MKRRVLVTGSSKGIGKCIAVTLASEGFSVVLHGRTYSDHLKQTESEIREISPDVESITFDISDRRETQAALEEHLKESGAFYGVVLNAGITRDGPFPGMKDEDWDLVLNTDLGGFFNVLRPLIMPMVQLRDGGRVVSISSLSGIAGNRGQVNYSAAKAGLIGASKALARELAKRRITVNCVAPGGVETDMIPPELHKEMIETIPMRRLGKPQEIASAVKYLFSNDAEYMTGQVLVLSGGLF